MFNFSYKCFLTILLSLIISVTCADKKEALHFSQNVPRLINSHDTKNLAKLKNYEMNAPSATACPAELQEEVAFNETYSITKNSLFVRSTYVKNFATDEIAYQICDNAYKLSLIYNRKADRLEFGLEIYYDKSKYEGSNFVDSVRSQFDKISNTHSIKNRLNTAISYMPSVPVTFSSRLPSIPGTSAFFQEAKIYLEDTKKTELGFIWIDLFFTKFNHWDKRVVQTSYNVSIHSINWKNRECDDYNLGEDYFSNIEIDNFYRQLYNEDNQKRMLAGVKVPTSQPDDEYKEAACASKNECFTKWLSIPSGQFHFVSAEPTSCSNLLTVPIWKSTIEKVLNKLDNFLHAISLVLGRLNIQSGVHGVLQLPTNPDQRQRTKKITLGKKDMSAPDILYKIVKHKITECKAPENNQNDNDESKQKNCVSSLNILLVVIHNNPYFNEKEDKICPEDRCKHLGWEEIQLVHSIQGVVKSKYIYCCPMTSQEERKKLGIKFNIDEFDRDFDIKYETTFSLKSIPTYDFETEKFRFANYYNLVTYIYKVMFEGVKFDPEEFAREREASHEKNNSESDTMYSIMEDRHSTIEEFLITEPVNNGDEPDKSELQSNNESEITLDDIGKIETS